MKMIPVAADYDLRRIANLAHIERRYNFYE
jgi:hypothetical protein